MNAILSILTAILASYLAAKWALRRFYCEKWWERKEKAYAEIIDALYDLLQYCEIKKEDYNDETRYSPEKMKEFSDRYSQAFWKVKKATDIGAFIVSVEAENILIELRDRKQLKWEENPAWDIYENDYKYYKNTLRKIVDVARRDLKASKN